MFASHNSLRLSAPSSLEICTPISEIFPGFTFGTGCERGTKPQGPTSTSPSSLFFATIPPIITSLAGSCRRSLRILPQASTNAPTGSTLLLEDYFSNSPPHVGIKDRLKLPYKRCGKLVASHVITPAGYLRSHQTLSGILPRRHDGGVLMTPPGDQHSQMVMQSSLHAEEPENLEAGDIVIAYVIKVLMKNV